ncbi:MAG: 30S ribosomal protein S4e, partial [Haloplanus sp.]
EGGRLALTEIDANAAGSKLSKVVDKTHVSGGGVQLNLHDGTNLRVSEEGEYGAGDSVIVDSDDGSVVAHFPYEEGALVTAVRGQHAGEVGRIEAIEVAPGSAANNVVVETAEGGFETVEEYVVVIDENFVEDESVLPGVESDAETDDAGSEDDGDGEDETEADDAEDATDDESGGDDE